MKNNKLTRFLNLANDHYWDSLQDHRMIILKHINEIVTKVKKIKERNIEIKILVPCPPKGYFDPERRPIFKPFKDILILIDNHWEETTHHIIMSGEFFICCRKKIKKDKICCK